MNTNKDKKGLNISVKSFITAIVIIFILMVLTYVMTFLVPGGEYTRIIDANGNLVIDVAGGFTSIAGGIPFWNWRLANCRSYFDGCEWGQYTIILKSNC